MNGEFAWHPCLLELEAIRPHPAAINIANNVVKWIERQFTTRTNVLVVRSLIVFRRALGKESTHFYI